MILKEIYSKEEKEDLLSTAVILQDTCKVRWSRTNKERYLSLGYGPYRHHEYVDVFVLDVSPQSREKVISCCPLCGKIHKKRILEINRCGHTCCMTCVRRVNRKNLIGNRYNRLLVIKLDRFDSKTSYSYWECLCDCGNTAVVQMDSLATSNTQSCGCLNKEMITEKLSGKNNHNYKPELTDEYRLNGRLYKERKNWREAVYERDNFTCVACGDGRGGNLNAHHVFSYSAYPEFKAKTWNGTALCKSCHKDFHNMYGYGENNFNQFLSWADSLGLNSVFA